MEAPSWILTFACPDRIGIVAAVAGALSAADAFILDSQQYADLETGRFFMRVVFTGRGRRFPADRAGIAGLVAGLSDVIGEEHSITCSVDRPRMLIAVSKGSHCLNDLLHRWRTGVLAIEPCGVVSNHAEMRGLAEYAGVPFHHLPVNPETRVEQEESLAALMESVRAEYLVLARYMQVLSDTFVARFQHRIVNIHHGFLPGFKGARPYDRAHARGVKLIGATAHFVTSDLDEGSIIEQAVERVDHRYGAADLARIGRDVETQVLARAVGWVAERRVLLNGERTVVFR